MRANWSGFLGLLAAACQNGAVQAKPPPLFPQAVPVALEPTKLEDLTLPRAPLLQTAILSPRLRSAAQADVFHQTPALLDVLWVVANTGAMKDERDRLAANLPSFTQVLNDAKLTWQLAVTSPDLSSYQVIDDAGVSLHTGDGCRLHGPIPGNNPLQIYDQHDPSYLTDFAAALTWDIVRSSAPSQTSIFSSLQLALDGAIACGASVRLLRPGAALAVIAASNSDDESFGDPAYFARYLKGLKGKGNEGLVTFSALGGPANGGCTPPGQELVFGAHVDPTPRLQALAQQTAGVFESICDEAGYAGALQRIALNLKTLRLYFPLSAPVDLPTLRVTVDGTAIAQDPQAGWQYLASINSIAFLGSYVPPPGSEVRITYAVHP